MNNKIPLSFLIIIVAIFLTPITNFSNSNNIDLKKDVYNLYKIKFLEIEINHYLALNNLRNIKNLNSFIPSDSIIYQFTVKTIEDFNDRKDFILFFGSYSVERSKTINISTGDTRFIPLAICKSNYYFLNEYRQLISFINNEVNHDSIEDIRFLIKLLFRIKFDNIGGDLIDPENLYLIENDESLINIKDKCNINFKNEGSKLTIYYYSLDLDENNYPINYILFYNELVIDNNNISIKKSKVN